MEITNYIRHFFYFYHQRKIKKKFFHCGSSDFLFPCYLHNPGLISIGDRFVSQRYLRLEAFKNGDPDNNVKIMIGNNVHINWFVHIGAINKVEIHDNVLIGSRVLIIDHEHGKTEEHEIQYPPDSRPLWSKGPVIIESNVWIGEGVCVLPGVTIGRNSIIGANSVVTKTIPPNSVAVGIPARVIKQL